jgi:lipopolysaccharide/colanic/teichoic acid biosynthesis glycosyltransferase
MKIRSIRFWILAADVLCVFGALVLAIGLRYINTIDRISFQGYVRMYFLIALAAIVVWILLYFEMSLDGFKGGWQFPSVFSKIIVAVSMMMLVVLAFAFLTKHYYSRLVLLYFVSLLLLGLIGTRCLARSLVTSRLRSTADHRCVILGNGRIARELAEKVAAHPELHFQVVGFLFPDESDASNGFASSVGTPLASVKTLQVLELLARENVQKLIIVMSQQNHTEVGKLLAECRKFSIQVYVVPHWYDLYVSRTELIDIDGLPLLSLAERNPSDVTLALKRAIDVMLSAGLLLLVSPLLSVAALVVYRRKGKAFRAELLCGKDGMPFQMYRLNVERHARNPRRYERLLARWSLTELPQLWNVLRGDMSLVGPRPESAERIKHYSDWQRQRLRVHGGVTGLAQVHGLREQHSSEDKARFDLQYIFTWSPLLDLSLILQTAWTLMFRGLDQEPQAAPTKSVRRETNAYVNPEVIDVNRP